MSTASPSQDEGAKAGAGAGAGAAQSAEAAKAAGDKGAYKLPDDLLVDGKPNLDKVISRLSEREAALASRGAPPESADKYEFKAPEGLKLPDGSTAEIDVDSDIFKQFRATAFEMGLPQEQAQKLFALGVEMQFGLLAQARSEAEARVAAEIAKLGSKGADRLNNVGNWFRANWGEDGAQFLERLSDHRDVVLLEKLISKFGGAGASGASPSSGGAVKGENDLAALYPSMKPKG